MSGLPKMYCRWKGAVNPCLSGLNSISTSLMCPESSALSFHSKLKSKEKQESRLLIFCLLWFALNLMPSRLPLPLWIIQWRPSWETTDADLSSVGPFFWLKSMHLHSLPHFACLETAALQGQCCHSNMRSNFGFLFFLGLAGEQRRQKSLNATESLKLWKWKAIWKINRLFSALSFHIFAVKWIHY